MRHPLTTPFLFFRAAGPDPDLSVVLNGAFYDDRKPIYDKLTRDAYWVKLTNTVHASFGDTGLIWDRVTFQTQFGAPPPDKQVSGLRVSQIVRAYLLSFFDKYLRGENDHLLDGPSEDYPEVVEFLKK